MFARNVSWAAAGIAALSLSVLVPWSATPRALAVVGPPPVSGGCPTSISSNFNGTAMPAGATVWFNSVMKVSGMGSNTVTIRVTGGSIDSSEFHVDVPNAVITLSPSVTTATTTYDAGTNTWFTTAPSSGPGNVFMAGAELYLPSGLKGGVNPVTWSCVVDEDTQGLTIDWKWGAAAYITFSTDLDALGVKPVDSNSQSAYLDSDHAGTPENFKLSVIGGARGGGGSNFTGSYSGTGHVCFD
jgi:hypothetical protein